MTASYSSRRYAAAIFSCLRLRATPFLGLLFGYSREGIGDSWMARTDDCRSNRGHSAIEVPVIVHDVAIPAPDTGFAATAPSVICRPKRKPITRLGVFGNPSS
jgi:hypothetical protein